MATHTLTYLSFPTSTMIINHHEIERDITTVMAAIRSGHHNGHLLHVHVYKYINKYVPINNDGVDSLIMIRHQVQPSQQP